MRSRLAFLGSGRLRAERMAVLIGSGAGQGLRKPALNPIDPVTFGHLSGQSIDAVWLRHLRTKKLQDKLPVLPVVAI